ncbi:cation channel sperm-associated targeting subunit tau [Saccopteryx bilineata]|uniref:cation channel sperm-associated targeting subunit tau n=1 Tax=Saccopteryx bilineata TaxID=59482 RepID=UPI00338DF0B0
MDPARKVARSSNIADSHGGRSHSLFAAPALQRSHQNFLDITHKRGSELPSFHNIQEYSKTPSMFKNQAKEGAGHKLLDMLRKTLHESESKEQDIIPETENLVPFGDVVGCLAVHIRSCRYFTPKINLQHYDNLCIRITINNVVKCTKMRSFLPQNTQNVSNERKTIIKFDDMKYFSVQVPKRQDDVRNNIHLDLIQYDNKEKCAVLLGSVQVHLYEVILKGCFTEEFQMLNKKTFVCRLEVEFMFSYGNFGYGFSHQLKPLQKIVEPSMFMNPEPPPERRDPVTNVIKPQSIEYPAFLSPDLNIAVGIPTSTPQSRQPSVVRLEKLQQQPRERLEKMKKEYRDLPTWREKAMYLEGLFTPEMEPKELKGNNTNAVPESQFEENPEDVTSDIPVISEEAKNIPAELLDNDKKGLTLPTSNQVDEDNLNAISPKSDESTKQRDTPLPTIPTLTITEGDKTVPLEEHHLEAVADRKLDNEHFQPKVKSKAEYPGILKSHSSSSEVAFLQEECIIPSLRSEYIEFKPKYEVSNFNTKDGFDPSLRNVKNKISIKKRNDQDMSRCGNILSEEVIVHEDQDPPYPTHSKTPSPADKTWPLELDITTLNTVDTNIKLASDPTIPTISSLDMKNKLKERLPSISLPNLEGESSLTGNTNVSTCRMSKSLSLTSHIENLKQSMVLKSILSENQQDLSDHLFSKPEVPIDTEARKKSHSSPLLSVHVIPSSSLEDNIFEKIQDLNSGLSKADILNSKSLVNPVIKEISAVSLSEGGPGNYPEVETEFVSEKHLEAGEIAFPMKKKSSFKKKHLESKEYSAQPGSPGIRPDFVIKQIFTAPVFSELETGVEETSETQMNWETLPSNILVHYEESNDKIELPEAKSVISQMIQTFPIETLLESGIIKVIEKEYEESSSLDTEAAFTEEKPEYSTEDYSDIENRTDSLSKQNIFIVPKETASFLSRVEFIDAGQNICPQDSTYQSTPDKKTDLPSNGQRLVREDKSDLCSVLKNLSNLLMGKLNESEVIVLESFFKNVFNVFFKYNQSKERRQPEKELEKLIQNPFPNNTEDLEEIEEHFDKADKLDRKPNLNPKLRVFLEALSESEIKILKSELSKRIQHYLVEKLSESGHITKQDLPKIYQNLYVLNENAEPEGQNVFLEKYSETVKETMSFVNNFNHHFIDKHLEIKLRSFLNEIFPNVFLKNLSGSSLFKETESKPMRSNIYSFRTGSASISFHELRQDISRGSFGRSLEINMKYPLNKSLQKYLLVLSENELLNLKTDLSKYLQRLFIEKLSKSGLITDRQLEGINNHMNLINSSSTPLKCIKPDLSFRDENQLMEKHSEKQTKYSKIVSQATLQKVSEDKVVETELTRKKEKEYFPLKNIKENPSIIKEQKRYPKEGAKTPTIIKAQTSSNKNTQAIPLKKSSEILTDVVLKKQRKEHGFMQLPQAENFDFKTEIQDLRSWCGKSKRTQSNACFERTPKMKFFEKQEHNIYKLLIQEKPEAMLPPCPGIPYCKMSNEDEVYVSKFPSPSRQSNTSTDFSSEAGENLKLEDQFCQRLKGYNNNKKHLVAFAHYEKETQALFIKPSETCGEKCAKVLESQSSKCKVVEAEKISKPSLFPKVLKRGSLRPKVRKERDRVNKQKSLYKIVKILPTIEPSTRTRRKSGPRTLLHWTARRTIHDCSDRFEDLHMTSFQHLEKAKSRARQLAKSPDASHNWSKHSTRPYTAPEVNKRREGYTGKLTSPRMVSAGLVHLNDTIPDYEIHKTWPKDN